MVFKGNLGSERGMSLIELLVCMGIAVLLCTMAIPRAVNLDKMYVKNETMYLLNTIRYTQVWAHGLDYYSYDFRNNQFCTPYLVFSRGYYYNQVFAEHKYTHIPEHGVKVRSNVSRIQFRSRGYASACTIRVSRGSYAEKVIIDVVGRVRVEEE